MTETRKLAAVMFTDIIGYTTQMSKNEQKALSILGKNRELQKNLAKKHNGEFLKEMGDGTLLCFQSALDGVRCAVEIQGSVKHDPDLNLRIGIHLGDIVFKEGDVFGDGVNVASRIEGLAQAGDICISEEVYRSIRNQSEMNAVFLAKKSLKNVDHLVNIYRISEPAAQKEKTKRFKREIRISSPLLWAGIVFLIGLIAATLLFLSSSDIPFSDRDWILITDFDNLTGDDVFNQSLNTALNISLQQSQRINVFPRSRIRETLTRMQIPKADTLDEVLGREIALRENIQLVVVPSISQIGEVYSLTVKIMDPVDQTVLKTEMSQADHKDDVLNALHELAQKVRKDLGESLSAIARRNVILPKATTSSLPALKYYAEGLKAWSLGNYKEAYTSWAAAVGKDSNFASAHAYLGGYYYYNNNRPKGEIHFTKALRRIETLTEKERLWIQSLIESWRGNHKEAIRQLRVLLAQYPNSSEIWGSIAKKYMRLSRFEEALDAYGRLLEIDRKNPHAFINIATCHSALGNYHEAIEAYLKGFELRPEWMISINLNHEFGFTYVKMGEISKAEEIFNKLLSEDDIYKAKGHRSLALLNMYQGKYGSAIQHLKEAIQFDQVNNNKLSEFRDRLYLTAAYQAKEMMTEVFGQLEATKKCSRKCI